MATSSQIPLRKVGTTSCVHHGGMLELFCEECTQLACMLCLSSEHKGHVLCALSEIIPQKKQDIKNFIDQNENVELALIGKSINEIDGHLKENITNFAKLSNQLKNQTKKLKEDLDRLTSEPLCNFREMERNNSKMLETYKEDLEKYNKKLKEQVSACKIALQRGCSILIYDTAGEISSVGNSPVMPTLGTAQFTPNIYAENLMKQALGTACTSGPQRKAFQLQGNLKSTTEPGDLSRLHNQKESQTRAVDKQDSPMVLSLHSKHEFSVTDKKEGSPNVAVSKQRTAKSSSDKEDRSPYIPGLKQQTNQEYSVIARQKALRAMDSKTKPAIHEATVIDEWVSSCPIGSICPGTDGRMWTCCSTRPTLTLLDRKGVVVREIHHNARTTTISAAVTTNLWMCDDKHNVLELVSDQLIHRFTTKETPGCLCITSCSHVVVGMPENITQFTRAGTIVRTTESRVGRPVVNSPFRIAECPVTHNLAVIDRNADGKEGKTHVVVLDKKLKKLFVYSGEVPRTSLEAERVWSEPFSPLSVVYDSHGNLVIGDCANNLHLLVSGRGEFIRVLHKDIDCSWAAGMDEKDILWVVFGGYNAKLIQYSSFLK
ncbi:uncharacterized protein LOC117340524 [Pecten maximus]|uniref:uncharacterized protein LOC117340524 n=1 Tax=Pecten maximus TaxID=6579 RepID=UPI0014580CA3|nr:uncharacterized protein LOC117340524 [Pecten maximus]